ncbi:MAG: sugar ABC transporter permease [Lachnospiraceae bacterium]|nr:sugar ABC transporter permease [Lachnospiraceae bacterium]
MKREKRSGKQTKTIKKYFTAGLRVKASMLIMGSGQMMQGQWIKGLIYFALLAAYVSFMVLRGGADIKGFFTLGSVKSDPWLGVKGDDSIMLMLKGIITYTITAFFIGFYFSNVRDAYESEERINKDLKLPDFVTSVKRFFDRKFYIAALALPVLGVVVFNIMPIVFMILIAFTNYGGDIVPPELVDWVGLQNFGKLVALSEIKDTFFKILGWDFVWAICATAVNYFGGLGLALLLNKKCVKGKTFWRAFPIIAYAVPGFITLLAFKFMFCYGGPINYYITMGGGKAIGFLDMDAGIKAKLIGLFVNAWISIPTSMLLATGILSNMNEDLYDAAAIDGANAWKQFTKITLPFVIFSTTPVLISTFVGNFNNFGIFYFLRNGLYNDGYFLASDTDLLINWLYNLTYSNNYYAIGAAISLVIFIITSVISLSVYVRSNAYKKEDTYR